MIAFLIYAPDGDHDVTEVETPEMLSLSFIESGKGRSDCVIKPNDKRKATEVVEFKHLIGTTTDVADLGNCLVIIRNLPCHKCFECNEVIYTGDVIKQKETIVKNAEMAMNEIAHCRL